MFVMHFGCSLRAEARLSELSRDRPGEQVTDNLVSKRSCEARASHGIIAALWMFRGESPTLSLPNALSQLRRQESKCPKSHMYTFFSRNLSSCNCVGASVPRLVETVEKELHAKLRLA